MRSSRRMLGFDSRIYDAGSWIVNPGVFSFISFILLASKLEQLTMAIIWQKKHQGVNYQVRSAGNSLRLYTDNVLHSQYNPQQKITGSVWDLLFLPALALAQDKPLRILVLGVGGGAVIHMLNEFLNCEKIVGLELNPVHVQVAEDFFALKADNIELVQGDAIAWVENIKRQPDTEKFDLIIDDLFYEKDGEPIKVASANSTWFYHLYSLLKPHGLIVMNFVGRKNALSAAPFYDDYVAKLLPNALHFTTPHYDNHVLAFSKRELNAQQIRQAIKQDEKLKIVKNKLRFSCRSR